MERPSALCEPFDIEKNDQGRGPIRVSREFVTKLNIDDLAGHARKEKLEKLVCSRGKGWRPYQTLFSVYVSNQVPYGTCLET